MEDKKRKQTITITIIIFNFPTLFPSHHYHKSHLLHRPPPYRISLYPRIAVIFISHLCSHRRSIRTAVVIMGYRERDISGSWGSGSAEGISHLGWGARHAPALLGWFSRGACCLARGRDWCWLRSAKHCSWCQSWSPARIFKNYARCCWDPTANRWLWQRQERFISSWGRSSPKNWTSLSRMSSPYIFGTHYRILCFLLSICRSHRSIFGWRHLLGGLLISLCLRCWISMMRCVCSLSRTNMLSLFHASARWAYNVWYRISCFCRAKVSQYISELYMFFTLHWNVSIFSWGYCLTHIFNRWLWCLVRDWRVILVLLSIYSLLLFWWLIFILLFSWIIWWRGRIGGQLFLILCDRWGGLCRRRSSFGGRSIALSYRTLPFCFRWNSCIRDDCAYATRISLGMSGVLRGFIKRVLIYLKI